MAKKPMVRQAYAATLMVKGKEVPPGTPISLEADEAERIAAMFGTMPVADEKTAAAILKESAPDTAVQEGVIAGFEQAVKMAQAAYDQAASALDRTGVEAELELAHEKFANAKLAYNVAVEALNKPYSIEESSKLFAEAEATLIQAQATYDGAAAALNKKGANDVEAKLFEEAEASVEQAQLMLGQAQAACDVATVAAKTFDEAKVALETAQADRALAHAAYDQASDAALDKRVAEIALDAAKAELAKALAG